MNTSPLSRRALLGAAGALAVLPLAALAKDEPRTFVEVWKDAGCGCCKDWVSHMEASGFTLKVHDGGHHEMRQRLGMPQQMASCHTALVGGYALEGHVPAADVRRLLKEKPQAVGLAVPGMPVGSPGMDGAVYGSRRDPFDVLLVGKTGTSRVYASYNKPKA